MLGIALGLASSVCWGISDFLGGIQSRRFSAFSVLLVSQPIGLVLALAVALALGDNGLPTTQFAVAAGGGAAGVLALAAFYRAMALGSVSVVATIGALAIVVPVVGGLLMGETPDALQGAGAAVAVVGILFVARAPDPEWRQANRASVGLAARAALGFGIFFLALDDAASHDAAWTIFAARAGGVSLLVVIAVIAGTQVPRARGRTLAALLVIGFFDIAANSLYAVATT